MHEHPVYPDDAIVNPETHHEKTDVSVRALLWFIALIVVFAFVMHFALYLLYKGFVRIERGRNMTKMTEMQRPVDMFVPKNQPLLQPFPKTQDTKPYHNTPVTDLADMRAAEQKALTTYGWADQQKGIVRIPIDQAMQLTLQRGLP